MENESNDRQLQMLASAQLLMAVRIRIVYQCTIILVLVQSSPCITSWVRKAYMSWVIQISTVLCIHPHAGLLEFSQEFIIRREKNIPCGQILRKIMVNITLFLVSIELYCCRCCSLRSLNAYGYPQIGRANCKQMEPPKPTAHSQLDRPRSLASMSSSLHIVEFFILIIQLSKHCHFYVIAPLSIFFHYHVTKIVYFVVDTAQYGSFC